MVALAPEGCCGRSTSDPKESGVTSWSNSRTRRSTRGPVAARGCLNASGWVIPSSRAYSVTGRSPARSSTRISRRCGPAIALKTSDVVAARAMVAM